MRKILLLLAFFTCVISNVSAQWTQQASNVTSNLFGVRFTSLMNGWIVGQNGAFLSTTDGGASWNEVSNQYSSNLNKVFFLDSLNGWIVGDYNVILSTTDGGVSWQQNIDNSPYMADYYGIFGMVSNKQTLCWMAGGRSYTALSVIDASSQKSENWYPQYIGFSGRLVRIFFLNASLGWATGDSGLILSTMNGGLSWNQDSSYTHAGLADIMFFDSLVGLCVGSNGLIMKSIDGGTHWKIIESTPDAVFFKLFLQGDSVAYVAGGPNDAILKSTNRGDTWTSQVVNAHPGIYFEDIYFINDSEGWAVGHDGVIVHTPMERPPTPLLASPLGTTEVPRRTTFKWNPSPGATTYHLQVASNNALDSIGGFVNGNIVFDTTLVDTVAKSSNPFAAGTIYFWHVSAANTAGTSNYSSVEIFATGDEIDAVNEPSGIPKEFALSQNYPNPFNPTTTISFALPSRSFVSLKVFDLLGREVSTLVSGEMQGGSYARQWNAANIASGVYFYRLQAGTFAETKKLLLLK